MLTATQQVSRAGQEQWVIEADGEAGTHVSIEPACGGSGIIPLVSLSPLSREFHTTGCVITEIDTSGAFVNFDLAYEPIAAGPLALVTFVY